MQFKAIVSVIFLLPLLAACGGKQPVCPSDLEPMYGEVEKSAQCKAFDEEYIADVEALGTPRSNSAQELSQLGFDYLNNGDFRTAIRRFNQAWLIDHSNCGAYNGFGVIKHLRDRNLGESVRMFELGLAQCPDNAQIMTNYGRVLEEGGRYAEAVSMFEKSLHVAPDNLEAYKGLILSHIQLGNDEATLGAMMRGEKYGLPLDRKLVDELKRRIRQAR